MHLSRTTARAATVLAVVGCALLTVTGLAGPALPDPAPVPDARTAGVQTVAVAWGQVGYRSVGQGTPLLLLIGGGGPADSIDDWPPALVDALARHHRVVAMDYEGIGRTSRRPGSISISRLADDTAGFLTALRLGPVDVLGWSMGGFVAQSLALRYPGLVGRLVLCASAPGNGTARLAVVSGSQAYPGQWLFPPDPLNRARAAAYQRAVHSYPGYYEGPADIALEEGLANAEWFYGGSPDGRRAGDIAAPVLVGDGSQDVLTPPPDATRLAAQVHGRLVLYRDAGHGFLVQHALDWARRVSDFLAGRCDGGSGAPCS